MAAWEPLTEPPLVVEASGAPFELGLAHGEQAAPLIEQVYDLRMSRVGHHLSERDALAGAVEHVPLLERWVPELLEEVRGVAAGSGLRFEQALFLQVATELELRVSSEPHLRVQADGCSAVGTVDDGGAAVIGQNWDQPESSRGLQIVTRLAPTGRPGICTFGWAGVIGYIAVSSAGVANVNTQLYSRRRPFGVPGYFVTRKLQSFATLAEGQAWLARVPTGSTAGYVVGDRTGAVATLELARGGARWRFGAPQSHTNHCLDAEWAHDDETRELLPDSYARLARLQASVAGAAGGIETVEQALQDHGDGTASVCRHGAHGLGTVASIVLDTAASQLHLRLGPPCSAPVTLVAQAPA
jgi:isopenicillin-N N-acyltransferase-like protein